MQMSHGQQEPHSNQTPETYVSNYFQPLLTDENTAPPVLPAQLFNGSKSRPGSTCSSRLPVQPHRLPSKSKTTGLKVFWRSEFSDVKRHAATCVHLKRNYAE